MRTEYNAAENEQHLYMTAEKKTWKDFPLGVWFVVFLTLCMFVVVLASFLIMRDARNCLLAIVAMIATLLFGIGMGCLFSPISSIEESQYPRILSTMGGLGSL
jgi:nitrate/nitrite transporter NarK